MTGFEPARTYVHVDLNHARLPTSPHPLIFNNNYSKSKFIYTKIQLIILNLNPNAGASGGIRTHTQLLAMDFESTSSTIPTHWHNQIV